MWSGIAFIGAGVIVMAWIVVVNVWPGNRRNRNEIERRGNE
jgi:hypothetical protein